MRPRTDASSYRYLQSLHEHAGDHYVLYPVSYTHLDVYKRQRLDGIEEVVGSNPIGSTKEHRRKPLTVAHS